MPCRPKICWRNDPTLSHNDPVRRRNFAPRAAVRGTTMADDPAHEPGRILIGKSDTYQYLTLALGNRHGLVAGATGTGKTVTLQVLAEGFSRAGTSVFTADVKGDLAGIAMPGDSKPQFVQRAKDIGIAYAA